MVCCVSYYFIVVINNYIEWIYIDDLCVLVRSFILIQDFLNNYFNGWFFVVFEKCLFIIEIDLQLNSLIEVFLKDKCYEIMQGGI